jgi:integrase
MSKMSDMAMTIEELRNAAAAINDAANWLAQQFSSDDKQHNENITAKPEKKTKPALTLEEVRAVLADKSRAGHTDIVNISLHFFLEDIRSTLYPSMSGNTVVS